MLTGSKRHNLSSKSYLLKKPNTTGACSERKTLPFPTKLIQAAFRCQNKHDQEFRLISKTTAEKVLPSLLFDSVFLLHNSHDLDCAKHNLTTFKASVETIIWSHLMPGTLRLSHTEFER